MKKMIVIFAVGTLVLAGLAAWMLKGRVAGDGWEIATTGIAFVLVGFAAALGLTRLRRHRRGEPEEDELSKRIMTRATSLAFYVSLYMWVFLMYIGDKVALPAHSLVGTGIAGMAVVFLFCWLGVRFFGTKNV
jgi:amino acid transporter